MIAEVIVDVSAYPIDRPFDYAVPSHLETVIECGSRVKVPFGPRKVIGYITGLKQESDIEESKLKKIDELIDLRACSYQLNCWLWRKEWRRKRYLMKSMLCK